MYRLMILFLMLAFSPAVNFAQRVTYSEFEREDNRDMSFEILGKMNANVLVYKNIRWKHKISIFGDDMKTIETVNLDFVPDKTYNVDFITYPDHFVMIYQYQKRNILYCMGVKLDAMARKIGEPVQLDTTQIAIMADNKIYSTIHSEDKQQIMVFKIHKKNERYSIVNLLFNNQLKLLSKSREIVPFEERRDSYGDFLVDNEGNFIFSIDSRQGNRENSNRLSLVTKAPGQDTFSYKNIDLEKKYVKAVNIKIDNLNKRYILTAFYYGKSRGSVEGLFSTGWDRTLGKATNTGFIPLYDSLRYEAKGEGQLRFALDDFETRQVIVKKDGSFVLTAEDYSSQTRGNNFNNPYNRFDYPNNYYYNSPGYSFSSPGYYYYNPNTGRYYRPFNSFNNSSTRFYSENIMVLSVNKNGKMDWSRVIHKEQFDDDIESYLSFSAINNGGEIHFIFNEDKKHQIIADYGISADGTVKRYPTLKSQERNYEFMPRHAKQVSARQLIVPCVYRSYICFAKVDL